jgi:hypothetical protein
MQKNILIAGLVAVIVVGGFAYWETIRNVPSLPTTTEQNTTETIKVKIALLDTTGNGGGPIVGCDTLTMVDRTVPKTSAPLTAALQTLFAEPEGAQPGTQYNFIARTKSTLKFDRATVENGTANIYLTGKLSGLAGVCDDPRAQIQIEETALQFATVQKVQIYLNGKAATLTPSEKGE